MSIRVVVFDVGETLVDETRYWTAVAERVGVPAFTFFGVLGGLIERGEHHRRVYELLGVERPSDIPPYDPGDFYPDALPCLQELREAGHGIGLAGNQPEVHEQALVEHGLDADFVASSERWGVEKPEPAFFERIAEEAGAAVADIAYVGDRVDDDVVPAADAGMQAVFLKRGPWGYLHADLPGADRASIRLDSLAGLAPGLAAL